MAEGIVTKSSEASKGGFRAIKKVQGVLQPPTREKNRFETGFGGKPAPDQAKVILNNAAILEMDEGEPEPELQDNKFTTWYTYAQAGKPKPNANTFFVKHFLKSGEALDAKRRGVAASEGVFDNLYGTNVILSRERLFMFKKPVDGDPDKKEDVYQENYVFSLEDEASPADIKDKVKKAILGKNPSSAKRTLMLDNVLKQHVEFKDAIDNETIGELVGVKLVDNIFVEGS